MPTYRIRNTRTGREVIVQAPNTAAAIRAVRAALRWPLNVQKPV